MNPVKSCSSIASNPINPPLQINERVVSWIRQVKYHAEVGSSESLKCLKELFADVPHTQLVEGIIHQFEKAKIQDLKTLDLMDLSGVVSAANKVLTQCKIFSPLHKPRATTPPPLSNSSPFAPQSGAEAQKKVN